MMDPRLREYLRQITVGSGDAIEFKRGASYASFLIDDKTQKAIAMCLILVGEAAKKIADRFPAFCDEHPEIPWKYIRGLRNRIAHDYFDLDFKVIWETVESELPVLVQPVAVVVEAGYDG